MTCGMTGKYENSEYFNAIALWCIALALDGRMLDQYDAALSHDGFSVGGVDSNHDLQSNGSNNTAQAAMDAQLFSIDEGDSGMKLATDRPTDRPTII